MKIFIQENEEVRNGFKISNNRKKIWNIQLGLFEQLKKICKKHDIKYYADGGTLLGAIRHKGYIPRDDDIDIVMFREDYDKFIEIAQKELPDNMKLREYYVGFSKIEDIKTTALGDDNWRDKDLVGGINIDIFPIDYASKSSVINHTKAIILLFLRAILLSQKSSTFIPRMKGWKRFFVRICEYIFLGIKISSSKIYNIHEKISRKVPLKSENIYNVFCPYLFFSENIYNESFEVNFENTMINIPSRYDEYLSIKYGNYLKPVIYQGGHHCWYSVDKSYKDIIENFDRSKSNEENYKNHKDLFTLE